MTLENNWKYKTLENLEKDVWPFNDYGSHSVRRTQELRKIPLDKFTTEDLRIMIGQQIGLDYLIPLTLEVLTNNLFAEGDLYEGDLLKSVLDIDTTFWNKNKQYWLLLDVLIKNRRQEIARKKFDTTKFDQSNYQSL